MTVFKTALFRSLLTAGVLLAAFSHAAAQDTPPVTEPRTAAPPPATGTGETGALNALLNEVRLLRIALQNTNTGAKRVQLAAERIRLQQERVDKVSRELEETRNLATNINVDQKRLDETIKELEKQARQEAFPARRAEIEKQMRLLKVEQEPLTLRETRLKDRESMLLAQLSFEQAKLNELHGKLDELEREFETAAALERPVPVERKKR